MVTDWETFKLFFCEICLFDHTRVITAFNLHQYNKLLNYLRDLLITLATIFGKAAQNGVRLWAIF